MKEKIPQLVIWQCVGWSGGRVYEGYNFYQRLWSGATECREIQAQVGFAVDLDTCADMAAAGLWMPEEKAPWWAEDMAWNAEKGIINDGRPQDAVTRAELAAVTHRLYNTIFEDMNRASGLLTDD